MSSLTRIYSELSDLKKNPVENCVAIPDDNNIFHWKAQIYGPVNTPYHGGIFNLDILFPNDYPFSPPKINFDTKVYHPNINSTGSICMDILKDNWCPVMTINKILLSICSLLNDPNPDDPLEPEIANEFKNDIETFKSNAASWTLIYASKS